MKRLSSQAWCVLTVFLMLAARSPASPGAASSSALNVAVLDFTVTDGASHDWSWAAAGLGDLFQIELQQLGLVTLDRDAIHAVLAEQRLAAGGLTAKDYLKLGGLLNAPRLVAGNLTPTANGRFRINARVFSTEAIETVVTASAEGSFPKDLPAALRQLALQAARKIQSTSLAGGETLPTVAPPKPEALIMFYHGLNACAQRQPDLGVAYFLNAEYLDPSFVAPLLWEIKAYELAGLRQFADIRRTEAADLLNQFGVESGGRTNQTAGKPVLAVLAPVVTGNVGIPVATLESKLQQALLATGKVRLFAFENIGDAMAEQDLKLSSFFTSQNAPRYGRWLASDALVVFRVATAEKKQIALDLALINPLEATTEARVHRYGKPDDLDSLTRAAVADLLRQWNNRAVAKTHASMAPELSPLQSKLNNADLRPDYLGLAAALAQVRREPDKTDSHKALASAFGVVGRQKLAAFEIERCLQTVDMRAPGADLVFFGLHRWLFWGGANSLGEAIGLMDKTLINHLIEQLFADYPASLATGCMHYNLAVNAWHSSNWTGGVEQAASGRRVIEQCCSDNPPNNHPVGRGLSIVPKSGSFAGAGVCELELIAATYFLEGTSLRKLGKLDEAREVFKRGQAFTRESGVRDFCLPLGPMVIAGNGPDEVSGYGGDAPGIPTRIKEELAILNSESPQQQGAEKLVRSLTAKLGSQQDWLRCTQQIADLLKQEPSDDMEVLRQILYWARTSLTTARYRAAPSAVLGPLVQEFVDTYLSRLGISSWAITPSVPSSKLAGAAVEVMGLYQSAGLNAEGWVAIEPLFSDPQPIEVGLDVLQQQGASQHRVDGHEIQVSLEKLKQLGWDPDDYGRELNYMVARMNAKGTNVAATAWVQLGQIYCQNHLYRNAVMAYQKAVAEKTSLMQCPGLVGCLLEMALQRNPEHAADEIERLRLEFNFPPLEATWVDWFQAGRKYQTSRPPDFYKAAAAYRNAIHFLENPGKAGVCHLEKQPNSERVALRWGPTLGEADLQWSDYYDRRWYSAAFYLAQCLIELNQKEEAAQFLRQIAIKVAGDSNIPLLDRDDWHSSSWTSGPGLGIRAAEMLQKLHETAEVTKVQQP